MRVSVARRLPPRVSPGQPEQSFERGCTVANADDGTEEVPVTRRVERLDERHGRLDLGGGWFVTASERDCDVPAVHDQLVERDESGHRSGEIDAGRRGHAFPCRAVPPGPSQRFEVASDALAPSL